MLNTEAIRDKSVAENKSRNLLEKVGSLGKRNESLVRRLSEEKDVTNEAKTEAQAAWVEAQATQKRAAELELR
jgi:Mg2+ and Co2+ transporter CorA